MSIEFQIEQELEKLGYSILNDVTVYNDGNGKPYSVKAIAYSDRCPQERDEMSLLGSKFICDKVIDVTTDDESEEGLSYSEFELNAIE